jgi:protein-L-isoaspartate(D-aspartate) O-methyltransferase
LTDAIGAALASVDYYAHVREPDGTDLPQSSSRQVIERMVRLADIRPGQHVLEIGTGSGYTAALLAAIVGPTGAVASIDVDARLVERARERHTRAGTSVQFFAGDGYQGVPQDAPYDRIIGWATPHLVPAAWLAQVADWAVILTPVKVAEIACANLLVRLEVVRREPARAILHPGNFIEMHGEPITDFGLPVRYVDAVVRNRLGTWWLSSPDLRAGGLAQGCLEHLAGTQAVVRSSPVGDPGTLSDLWAWLYAVRPVGLAALSIPGHGSGIGYAEVRSAVVLRHDAMVTLGNAAAVERVTGWLGQWGAAGRPAVPSLTATVARQREGWTIRPAVPEQAPPSRTTL